MLFFITDTNHQDIIQTKRMSDLKKLNVKMYALGIGSAVTYDTLQLLTDVPKNGLNQVYRFDSYQTLMNNVYTLKI